MRRSTGDVVTTGICNSDVPIWDSSFFVSVPVNINRTAESRPFPERVRNARSRSVINRSRRSE